MTRRLISSHWFAKSDGDGVLHDDRGGYQSFSQRSLTEQSFSEPLRLPRGQRALLIAGTSLSAFVFGWAALVLPSRVETPLALLAWALALLHLGTCLAALCRPERLRYLLRLLGLVSSFAAPVFVVAIGLSSVELVKMFGPLGWGLTALLSVIGWLLLVGTLPLGLWALRLTAASNEHR